MHPINRERYVHNCLDKKIAMTPYLLDFEKCVTPKGHTFVSATPFYIIPLEYTVLECPTSELLQTVYCDRKRK
jgi:hypothetical protein